MNNKTKNKRCPSCGGEGGYYPSPHYNPFKFNRCSTCEGTGLVPDGDKKEEDTAKNRIKDSMNGWGSDFF